jgi:hypothetical protein
MSYYKNVMTCLHGCRARLWVLPHGESLLDQRLVRIAAGTHTVLHRYGYSNERHISREAAATQAPCMRKLCDVYCTVCTCYIEQSKCENFIIIILSINLK